MQWPKIFLPEMTSLVITLYSVMVLKFFCALMLWLLGFLFTLVQLFLVIGISPNLICFVKKS